MMQKNIPPLLLTLILSIIYIVAGKLGLTLAFANASATAIWPPTGIALVALLIFGRRAIPAILLGAFIVNLTTTGHLASSIGIAIGNTLEGIVGAYLVKRFANGIHAFESFADIFKFTFLAGLVATTVSANIGVFTLILGNLATWKEFFSLWLTWWLGDMGGNLILAPLLLIWWTHPRLHFNTVKALHLVLCFVCIFLVTEIIFLKIVPFPYLYIPLIIWIALWFGRRGATSATIVVAAIMIFYTLDGHGPFISESLNTSMIQLQIFLTTLSLTSLFFATAVLEIRKSEKLIATHEEHFKAMIEHSFDAIFIVDATSRIIYASPSVKRLLGYDAEELRGSTGFNLVVKEDRPMTVKVLAEIVVKPNGAATIETRLIKKDKSVIWVEATGTNLLLVPSINGVVVNFHDITEKKLADQKLLQDQMETQAMFTSLGDGIIATDRDGKITMINKIACDMLGWKQKELIDKSLIEQIPLIDDSGNVIPATNRPLTRVIKQAKESITSRSASYIRKDRTKLPVHFTVTPIILDNVVIGTIEVFQDITKEKEIDRAKTEFVSVASHQLRTPLATINWYLEELLRTGQNFSEKQKGYVSVLYTASRRMVALINSLLNATRLELGSLIVQPASVNVRFIIKETLQDLYAAVEAKHITIVENYQENIPEFSADPKLLEIIIQNILSNAIKYSKNDGKIEIKILYNDREFLFSVTDEGYGIPKNQQIKIFSKLFRADNARSLEPEGTGLGLYIVKEIIETTGGKIWFVSQENKGTIFSISYPRTGMQKKEGKKLLV
jgi:PAS domain S-box-containing protein